MAGQFSALSTKMLDAEAGVSPWTPQDPGFSDSSGFCGHSPSRVGCRMGEKDDVKCLVSKCFLITYSDCCCIPCRS